MKKFILFITVLFSIVMLSCTTAVCAAEYREEQDNVFQLLLCADDSIAGGQSKPDLSGIKVDVYSSALTSYDNESELSEFTHQYAFSVYTDVDGKIQFTRPSDEILILVDVSTLPRNIGIAISTKFYRKDVTQDKLFISKVEKIKIEKDVTSERQFFVNVYNKEGTRINVDYTLYEKSSVTSGRTETICMEASVGDITESYEYTIPFSTVKYVESIEELLMEDRISESDALNSCLERFYNHGRSQELIDQVLALKENTLFYETISPEQKAVVEEILSPPSYNKSYRSGNFVIYYTSSSDMVPVFITSLMSAIQTADASLVGGLSFQRPRSNEQGTAEYYIYVSSQTDGSSAYCVSFVNDSGVRTSYIEIRYITDLSVEVESYQQGTVAHEYMHAITHAYRALGELPGWFTEAWADWAAVRVKGIASRNASSVNGYLSNIYKTFTTDENSYGKLLLPLYIGQKYGGDTTVANVIKNLAATESVFTAMNNALPSGVTFGSIFPNFMGYNYAPTYFYTTHSDDWSKRPFISADYPLNGYPNGAYGGMVNPLAAHYREFAVPIGKPYNLNITINQLDNYSALSGKLHMNKSSEEVTNWSFTTEGALVTYSISISKEIPYIKGGISIVNTDFEQTNYQITIARN